MVRPDEGFIRTVFFAVLALGLAGTGMELVLLKHYETAWQVIPLVLIALGLSSGVWYLLSKSSASLIVLRIMMTVFIASGVLGVALHYRGAAQFQKELDPSIAGYELFMKVIHAKAPPALAPAAMIWFGLLGLTCTYLQIRGEERL